MRSRTRRERPCLALHEPLTVILHLHLLTFPTSRRWVDTGCHPCSHFALGESQVKRLVLTHRMQQNLLSLSQARDPPRPVDATSTSEPVASPALLRLRPSSSHRGSRRLHVAYAGK